MGERGRQRQSVIAGERTHTYISTRAHSKHSYHVRAGRGEHEPAFAALAPFCPLMRLQHLLSTREWPCCLRRALRQAEQHKQGGEEDGGWLSGVAGGNGRVGGEMGRETAPGLYPMLIHPTHAMQELGKWMIQSKEHAAMDHSS